MITPLYVLPFIAVIGLLLVRAEILKIRRQIYVLKPIATLLVIVSVLPGFTAPLGNDFYTAGVLLGLCFSFGGDVSLMFIDNRKAFTAGLALFLLAHIVYASVFSFFTVLSSGDIVPALILFAAAAVIYRIFSPNLGNMRIPVIFYIIIISVMVHRAFSLFRSGILSNGRGTMILAGSLLFYVSDVMLASARFRKAWKYNRISLFFYYSGQFLIAAAASVS